MRLGDREISDGQELDPRQFAVRTVFICLDHRAFVVMDAAAKVALDDLCHNDASRALAAIASSSVSNGPVMISLPRLT